MSYPRTEMQVSFNALLLAFTLLAAAFTDWSLISLLFLQSFFLVQYKLKCKGNCHSPRLAIWAVLAFAIASSVLGVFVASLWGLTKTKFTTSEIAFLEIVGLSKLNPSKNASSVFFFLLPKFVVAISACSCLHNQQCGCSTRAEIWECEGFDVRALLRSFVLPTVQVVAGTICPSWITLPYFICSCSGLFHWSMTNNFVGLSWGWRPLLFYSIVHITILYMYQIPISLPHNVTGLAEYIGLFKLSLSSMSWLEGLQALSLIGLYMLLCFAVGDMEDFESTEDSALVDDYLPLFNSSTNEHLATQETYSPHTRSSRKWRVWERRKHVAFQQAAVYFFTYGFPICLIALVAWSFKFESLCAFVLLLYVGFVLYVFPSLACLRRLNALLLGFILLWASSTYIFNAAFTIMTSKFTLDTVIWQTVGLWRYSSPGLFIMAQFALGVLVATDLFAGNTILDNQREAQSVSSEEPNVDEEENRWILLMAVAAWCIHRSAHVICLILIFVVGLRNGLIHAVYMIFFMVYLMVPSVARNTRQYLMLYCEIHLAVLYLLQLEWISRIIGLHKDVLKSILSQLGIWNKAGLHDYVAVALLLCFCAIQNHGIKVISSLSATAKQTVAFPVYLFDESGHENWITNRVAAVAERFRALYRSFGTYVVYITVLVAVYTADPNYVTFGFLLLLIFWIIGRQVLGKTESPFWIPLLVYTSVVFLFRYTLSVFPDLQKKLGNYVALYPDLGFDPDASLLSHIWDSLAVLSVMQLYRYERAQSSDIDEDSSQLSGNFKFLDFVRRLLILHSGKILALAVFYVSITPVSGFGFLYLLILVLTCNVRKTSMFPAQIFALYTGVLLILEYLYQLLGDEFFGEQYGSFAYWLGFREYEKGFWGIEAGTRSKSIVLVACMLQYCSFQWLELLPTYLRADAEPCCLFASDNQIQESSLREPLLATDKQSESYSDTECMSTERKVNHPTGPDGLLSRAFSTESRKWSRRAMLLKQEKYEAQWNALRIHGRYLLEHFFDLYGTEITMLCLLVGSFAVLNIFSLVYLCVLALCMLLTKRQLCVLWPWLVALFAAILVGQYATLAKFSWDKPDAGSTEGRHCHECWMSSMSKDAGFCWNCWLGAVDDRQMLVAYFMVFIISTFQLRANKYSESAGSSVHSGNLRLAWADISYETTDQWTWLDYFRFFFYCHLLHVVLLLVFITGTLQYDFLHLGYLAFSMVFFRMRSTIMKKRNAIFRSLRLYNYILILASLIFQAPFFGYLDGRGCTTFSIFGLYKYDYGFRITARSAVVDITIFCLVGLQSRIFRTREFEQVLRYLAAEQVEARARAQEKKAAWKKEQLQRIREVEERKVQRHLQVEKMKLDMAPLQLRLDVLNSAGKYEALSLADGSSEIPRLSNPVIREPLTPSRMVSSFSDSALFDHFDEVGGSSGNACRKRRNLQPQRPQDFNRKSHSVEQLQSPRSKAVDDLDLATTTVREDFHHAARNGLLSSVSILGDGVAQMQNIGSKALANLVGLLNLEQGETDDSASTSSDEPKAENTDVFQAQPKEVSPSEQQQKSATVNETRYRLSMIFTYCWSKILANTDIVCYAFFILVYVWNFSLLTLVFPASLFLYALLVNPGPTQFFWSAMLIYTELSILLQYMYQILVNHCGNDDLPLWLQRLGVPGRNLNRSFVASVLPLFLVYLSTLVQSSIKARDGEWMFVSEDNSFFSSKRSMDAENQTTARQSDFSVKAGIWKRWVSLNSACVGAVKTILRCWTSLTKGSEAPPHFVQVTLSVPSWPVDGIQPERIESAFNRMLVAVRKSQIAEGVDERDLNCCSRVRVESIEGGKDSTARAVLEVIYAAPHASISKGSLFTSLTPASDVASEITKAKHQGLLEEAGFPYRIISVVAGGKKEIDLYAYIFGTDLIAFLYVGIFYQSAIKNSPEFLDVYQLEDQFPKEFVFVLMTLFFLIVLDRVLYLSAFAAGKVFYYFFSLALYTSYISSFVWGMELKHDDGIFFQLLPLRGFYLLKALSLSLQALQLRYGLPHKSGLYGQFLMRRINSLSWLGFRIYRGVPFLFELRCVLDWSCTTTALAMYDWLKLEDIYASLFLVQCDIKLAREKHTLGQKRSMWIKFCNGVCLFFILICVIWAPMMIYSSGNPTNFVNPILQVHAQIDLKTSSGSFTLYETKLCKLHAMSDVVMSGYKIDPDNSLSSFDLQDIQLICCEEDASSSWLVPPPTLQNLIKSFNEEVDIVSTWEFIRERPKNKEMNTFTGFPLEAGSIQEVLTGSRHSVYFQGVYPRFFRLTSAGEVRVLEQTSAMVSGELYLKTNENQMWWSFVRDNATYEDGCGNVNGPLAVAVSEEVPKGLIGDTLSKFNIWSLYITFVLAVGRFIRLQCADLRMRIPYENFPTCERLIAICEDIYAARAEGELELEEGLFWTLVKIYRSPHILMEYTKSE